MPHGLRFIYTTIHFISISIRTANDLVPQTIWQTPYYLYDPNNRNKFCFKLLIVYSLDVMVIMIQPYFVMTCQKGCKKLF